MAILTSAVRNMETRRPASREIMFMIKVCRRSIFACACANCALDILAWALCAWRTIHARLCVAHVRLGDARGYCLRCPLLTLGHDMRHVAVAGVDYLKALAFLRACA